MSRIQRRETRSTAIVLLTTLLTACGGGGGDDDSPPVPNRAPIVAQANADQRAFVGRAFEYDALQGGATFEDPDGDELTYDIYFTSGGLPPGLEVDGTRILGVPERTGLVEVQITAIDSDGLSKANLFWLRTVENSDPVLVQSNPDHLVSVGDTVDLEVSGNREMFTDPDGDPLTYEVTLRGAPVDLTADDTRVVGTFSTVGLVEVTVSADDGFGGVASDVFTIAAPAPEPGRPTLPDEPHVYVDSDEDLPYILLDYFHDREDADNLTTNAGAALGRVLFYDKRLSNTNTVSCGSCHHQASGFAAPERFSVGALGVPTKRNVMALANVRFNPGHNWFSDMRATSLRELALMPIENPEELGGTLEWLEAKLAATEYYPPLFEAAFGTPEVTLDRVSRALAQFLQSMISYQSRFDEAYNPPFNGPGDPESVLTAQELRGAAIFGNGPSGVACTVCHDDRTHINTWQANNGLDAVPTDPGVLIPVSNRGAKGVFRAASLRNLAVTAPYMHDGRFATLREVIDHYDHGIQFSDDLDTFLFDQLLNEPRRLNLSEEDKLALEAFLNTLTDDTFLTDPKFSDPFAP